VHSQNCEEQLSASSRLSVCIPSVRPSAHMQQLGSHWTDLDEIDILLFFYNLSIKFRFHYNLTRISHFTWRPIYIYVYFFSQVFTVHYY